MIRKYTSLTALVFVVATPALAQDAAIDVDEDGMYSYPELLAVMPEMTEDEFVILDVNGDGLLDAEEIAAAQEAGAIPASEG